MKTGKSQAGIEVSPEQFLTGDELIASGSELTLLEIPELPPVDGKVRVVYIKSLSAGDVIDSAGDDETTNQQSMLSLIAKAVVGQNGTSLFTEEQVSTLRSMRADVFTRLSREVQKSINVDKGDESSPKGSQDTDSSPTGSQPN